MRINLDKLLLIWLTILIFGNGSEFSGREKRVLITDGRKFAENLKSATETEKNLVAAEIRRRQSKIKKFAQVADFRCDEDDKNLHRSNSDLLANLSIYAVLGGAFTKPGVRQKAFLYHLCWSDGGKYATALGGIMIFEKRRKVSHFAYVNVSGFDEARVLPDINRNGFAEMVLRFTSKIDGLNFSRSVGVFEFGEKKLKYLGETVNQTSKADVSTAYRISAASGRSPVFYRETFKSDEKTGEYRKTHNGAIKISLKKARLENVFNFIELH